jgi:excinuclease ABC subunit A
LVEHNLEIIKHSDYLIDLGPEAGERGGKIMATGTPLDMIKASSKSVTGRYLKAYVEGQPPKKAKLHDLDS